MSEQVHTIGFPTRHATHLSAFAKQLSVTKAHQDVCDLFEFVFPVFSLEGQRRRYAPGSWMGRGRYWSLARTGVGDDQRTLAAELDAYRDMVRTGYVRLMELFPGEAPPRQLYEFVDAAGAVRTGVFELPKGPPEGRLVILVYDREKLAAHFGAERMSALIARYGVDSIFPACASDNAPIGILRQVCEGFQPCCYVSIPWVTRPVELSGTLDLRLPSARRWLIEQYKMRSPDEFYALLPFLLSPSIGGSEGLSRLGLHMLSRGFRTLVYPSARTDVSVELAQVEESAQVIEFAGWNLVDFFKDDSDMTLRLGDRYLSETEDEARDNKRETLGLHRYLRLRSRPDGSFRLRGIASYNYSGQAAEAMVGQSKWTKGHGPRTLGDDYTALLTRKIGFDLTFGTSR